jgi:hypothetical protein
MPAAAASAAASAPGRAPSAGGIELRLVDVPVIARNDPRARIYIVDHLAPGTVIHRRIELTNTTISTAHVVLYPAAATVAHGAFLGAAGHTANDLSTWTSVRPGASAVPAGGRLMATVTIAVPPDAAAGEQYGVVWAETRAAPGAGGLTQVSRVGIRIYLSVGPGGPPAADFAIESLTAKRSPEGQPMVLATVHNTGGRTLDIGGNLRLLAGPGGVTAGPFPATLDTTLTRGATEPVTITLDRQLPAGPWDARITLHSGLVERDARATITFPETGASPAVQASPVRRGWLIPALIAAAVGVVLGLATWLGTRGRRWRRLRRPR